MMKTTNNANLGPSAMRPNTHRVGRASYPSPNLALTGDPRWQPLATAGTNGLDREHQTLSRRVVVSDAPVKRKPPLSRHDNGGQPKRVMRFELTTFTLATCGRRVLNYCPEKSYGAPKLTVHLAFPTVRPRIEALAEAA